MKTKISATVVADSIAPNGVRLTTMELVYPRFILAEFNTHRMFSRNSASSRAIPIQKMIRAVLADPVCPVEWGKNQKGMQARSTLGGWRQKVAKALWMGARYPACWFAYALFKVGLHKQISNRLLEPWMWTRTLVTATEWDNFFELRAHEDAQPEIRRLAEKMRGAMENSMPKVLGIGNWHLPYITREDRQQYPTRVLIEISSARCARVSYLNHNNEKPWADDDVGLYNDLVGSKPLHASPTEHPATPMYDRSFNKNYRGWYQHRSDVEAPYN